MLKDLQLFEAEAATLNIKHDMAKLEASRLLKLLRVIPEPLRAAHGLPTGTKEKDYEKLIHDCDRATESIFQIVKNTHLAWIEKASRECLPQHNVSFEHEYSGGGLLRAIASSDDVELANKDAVAEVLAVHAGRPRERKQRRSRAGRVWCGCEHTRSFVQL